MEKEKCLEDLRFQGIPPFEKSMVIFSYHAWRGTEMS